MADNYIDNQETLAYGEFAVSQIPAFVLGLDPALDSALRTAAQRLATATDAMRAALKQAGEIDWVTYNPAQGSPDVIAEARSILRRIVNYAASRENGDVIVEDILAGDTLSTVLKRRPEKLSIALAHALTTTAKYRADLPEHARWTRDLTTAKAALDELNATIRKSRAGRHEPKPEVAAARAAWFTAYGAAKLIVEAVLVYQDKILLLEEVFDDLAEVHRVPGVIDDTPSTAPRSF